MLKGSSLFYALAIAVLIAMVSSAILSCAYFSEISAKRNELNEILHRNARSGINWLLANEDQENDLAEEKDLFGNGGDSVFLQKKSWGVYGIVIAKAHRRENTIDLVAMIGFSGKENDRTALMLADLDHPLSICGDTRLKGDCYVPGGEVNRAYIEGQNYTGDQLVYGEIKKADRFLPVMNKIVIGRVKQLFHFRPDETTLTEASLHNTDSITNSFRNDPLCIFSAGGIVISNALISGQVMIVSQQSILVTKSSGIQNAILVAPYIKIDDDVHGCFQAFASDSLTVGNNAVLSYPSALGLLTNEKSPLRAILLLGEKSACCGELFAFNDADDFRKHVLIRTGKNSKLYGNIFSADLAELKGTVYGKVTCAKLELITASAGYENHLLNTVIDKTKLSPRFVSGFLSGDAENKKAILQWLN